MPDLKPEFFTGSGDLPPNILNSLSTPSAGIGMRDTLTALGWQGEAAATICLTLSADGTQASHGSFSLWGLLSEDTVKIPTHKLWEGTPRGTTLRINNFQGQQFRFTGGTLQSEHMDADNFDYSFHRGGQVIPQSERQANGLGNFSLRAFAHLDKSSNKAGNPLMKITILAAPLSADELTALSDRTQHASWPGLKILESKAAFFPLRPAAAWGCPIWPLLCIRDPSSTIHTTPSGQHLRFAIAAIMRTAALPTACTSRGALHEKGQEAIDATADPDTRYPSITWPAVDRPAPAQGNLLH